MQRASTIPPDYGHSAQIDEGQGRVVEMSMAWWKGEGLESGKGLERGERAGEGGMQETHPGVIRGLASEVKEEERVWILVSRPISRPNYYTSP